MNYANLYFSFEGKLTSEYEEREKTPIAVYSMNGIPPFVPLQRKESLSITLIKRGFFDLTVNGVKFTVKEGDVIVLPPFALYTLKKTDELPIFAETVSVDLKECARYDSAVTRFLPFFANGAAIPSVFEGDINRSLAEQTDRLCDKFKNGEETFFELEQILKYLHDGRKFETRSKTDGKNEFSVMKIAEQITDLSSSPKISEIAANCGYSEFYAMKLFKKYADCSIVDYSVKFRISAALQMILTTNEDIADIARTTGFDNVSYFNRQFKRLFNKTPKQFRETG